MGYRGNIVKFADKFRVRKWLILIAVMLPLPFLYTNCSSYQEALVFDPGSTDTTLAGYAPGQLYLAVLCNSVADGVRLSKGQTILSVAGECDTGNRQSLDSYRLTVGMKINSQNVGTRVAVACELGRFVANIDVSGLGEDSAYQVEAVLSATSGGQVLSSPAPVTRLCTNVSISQN